MSKKKNSAFTLIELLVVISIIALLIAILLPALGAARGSARNSQCLSRLRNMAIAVTAYEVENKGLLPRSHGGNLTIFQNEPDYTFYFSEYLEDYMELASSQDVDFYLCPDSTVQPGPNQRRISYSAFEGLFINRDQFATKRVKVSSVKRPTEVIAIGDAAQQGPVARVSGPNFTGAYHGPYTDPTQRDTLIAFPDNLNQDVLTAPNDGYHFRFRHSSNNTANANFIDGHAESFQIGQVEQRNFAVVY